ncbi:unnamed protein product [Cylicocyclus nassatus]|uniref:BTB domain-containing protein n=1 Tax=Cylicocyclus nassatus TaxID=53992 RepID=A0AA36DQS0_CYLNA|nr:unnamed protein product [Cylicocyclus nassatus]
MTHSSVPTSVGCLTALWLVKCAKTNEWKDKKDKPRSFGERVKINVGGTIFETYLSTLTRADGTVLSAMVASRWRNQEEIFIDRNPVYFAKILDYLRDSEHFTPPSEEDARDALRKEAEFYNLPGLAEICSPDVFHIGDNVQWKESAVESYWKLLLQLWFNRKYEDIFVWVSCVDCKEPVAQREYRGYVDSAFKHFVKSIHVRQHMLSARGVILSLNGTCCRVQWDNGWQTHLPQSLLRLAKK